MREEGPASGAGRAKTMCSESAASAPDVTSGLVEQDLKTCSCFHAAEA